MRGSLAALCECGIVRPFENHQEPEAMTVLRIILFAVAVFVSGALLAKWGDKE
jgi:hypothetical protein